MGLFDIFNKPDTEYSDIEKNLFAWDEEDLRALNGEELDAEFSYMNAISSRSFEKANQILNVMREKGMEMPESKMLYRVIQGMGGTEEDKRSSVDLDDSELEGVIKGRGPMNAMVAFVGASPSRLDKARDRVFSGPVGRVVKDTYLPPLGLSESQVYLTNIVPEYLEDEDGAPREPTEEEIAKWSNHFMSEMEKVRPAFIVAMGKTAKEAIEGHDEWVPHPRAVSVMGDSGEVERKMTRLRDRVEKLASENKDQVYARTVKADKEKQVVYGVVVEPETLDTDENWAGEEAILDAAHRFVLSGMTMKHEHSEEIDDATVVETFIAPTDFKMGDEDVKKGSWVVGVKVFSEERWDKVMSGEYTGFSFGGRAKINPDSMI